MPRFVLRVVTRRADGRGNTRKTEPHWCCFDSGAAKGVVPERIGTLRLRGSVNTIDNNGIAVGMRISVKRLSSTAPKGFAGCTGPQAVTGIAD